ncbi:MAG TPA: hypothetical protein VK132_11240, partial [Gemmatimonadales bacterium]|nr:hypothetical protein [Gemmatimonadales bacterium]
WSPDGKRIAFMRARGYPGGAIWIMSADGSGAAEVAHAAGSADDMQWGDPAWSADDWILFVVGQTTNGCFKTRLDKIRPDGTARTKVTDGGPNCTPQGMEQSGDADPGFSADGKTIFTSRGFPQAPAGAQPPTIERKLYAVSSDAWTATKPETDLSLLSEPSCVEGVPKGSPDGLEVLLFRACFDQPGLRSGVFVTDTAGFHRTFVADGFGPDWNPR